MFLSQHTAGSVWGYGLFILETLVALGVIAVAGFMVVKWSQKRMSSGKGSRMRVVERLPLEHRRSLHLVEVDGRTYLIGTSEQAIQLVAPLDDHRADGELSGEKLVDP